MLFVHADIASEVAVASLVESMMDERVSLIREVEELDPPAPMDKFVAYIIIQKGPCTMNKT